MKKFDSFFKNKLNVPQKAPDDAWDYIQQHLPPEEKEKPFFFGKKTLLTGLLLLTISGAGLMIGGDKIFTKSDGNNQGITDSGIKNSEKSTQPFINSEPIQSENQVITINQAQQNSNDDFNSSQENYAGFGLNNNFSTGSKTNYTQTIPNRTATDNNYGYAVADNNYTNYNSSNRREVLSSENSLIEVMTQNYSKTSGMSGNWLPELNMLDNNVLISNISTVNHDLIAMNEKSENKSNQKNKKIKPKLDFDKFIVSGFISPTGLNTFVGSSMLSNDLSDYKTENTITLAYGLKAAYALNPNLKIRTGLSVIGFEQITKNVMFSSSITGQSESAISNTKNNINYSGDLRIFNNQQQGDYSYRASSGDIQQQTQYLEIPIEAEYSLFDTGSIGISVTGGGSTWLLSKNKIYAHTESHTEELGTADNLNKTSFSANAGLKFDMKITDGVQLNVEPNFKYLLNPVNNIEKYSPYTVGVNAGISIKLK